MRLYFSESIFTTEIVNFILWPTVTGPAVPKISTNQMLVEIKWRRPWSVNKTGIQSGKMPSNCIVKGCKSYSGSGDLHFHRLPWRNKEICKQWLIRAGKTEKELENVRMIRFRNARICSRHFGPNGPGKNPITGVPPSLNLPGL